MSREERAAWDACVEAAKSEVADAEAVLAAARTRLLDAMSEGPPVGPPTDIPPAPPTEVDTRFDI
jgi:outer membrane protein TolC